MTSDPESLIRQKLNVLELKMTDLKPYECGVSEEIRPMPLNKPKKMLLMKSFLKAFAMVRGNVMLSPLCLKSMLKKNINIISMCFIKMVEHFFNMCRWKILAH